MNNKDTSTTEEISRVLEAVSQEPGTNTRQTIYYITAMRVISYTSQFTTSVCPNFADIKFGNVCHISPLYRYFSFFN